MARFLRVMPLAFITYSLAYLDRQNYGLAEAAGMKDTLHVGAGIGSLLPALFFLGYCLFQIPGAAYAAHHSAKRLIFWALLLWGILSALTGMVLNVPLLISARVLLGVVEGVVFPALLVFLTHWFTKREKSRANTLLIVANPVTMLWMSVVSGFLIRYFDHHRVFGLVGWRMMFVLEGLPSMLWALVWLWLADDRPRDAKWLRPEEAAAVQDQLDAEQRGIPHVTNYWAAFRDWRVILLCVMYFGWSNGSYGLTMWLPSVVKEGSKADIAMTGVISAIPYAVATLAMLAVSFASDYTLKRKAFIWPTMLIGAAAFITPCVAGPGHFHLLLVALTIAACTVFAPCGCLWAMVAEMVPRNVVGESMALINSAGALGGFCGTFVVGFLNGVTHRNESGFLYLAAMMAAAAVAALAVRPALRVEGFPVVLVASSKSA
jgi:sugar phosphate permease